MPKASARNSVTTNPTLPAGIARWTWAAPAASCRMMNVSAEDNTVQIMGYDLVLTCGASPEQYDVFKDGEQVAYMRLRHGNFRVDCPGYGGKTVYRAAPDGDYTFDDDERVKFLKLALEAIDNYRITQRLNRMFDRRYDDEVA